MSALPLLHAAELLDAAYTNSLSGVIDEVDQDGVQAYFLQGDILLVMGQNELSDWFRYSLDPMGWFGPKPALGREIEAAATRSGLKWHQGFLEYAQVVFDAAQRFRPRFVIGHSLGAAAAQIVGLSLELPAIGFASPRPCFSAHACSSERFVLNLCRTDDQVCYLPPRFLGFRMVGRTVWLKPASYTFQRDHQMPRYLSLLRTGSQGEPVPEAWPL